MPINMSLRLHAIPRVRRSIYGIVPYNIYGLGSDIEKWKLEDIYWSTNTIVCQFHGSTTTCLNDSASAALRLWSRYRARGTPVTPVPTGVSTLTGLGGRTLLIRANIQVEGTYYSTRMFHNIGN